jgi:hypothetical protein
MDPFLLLLLIFAVFVPVGIVLALVVFPAMRRKRDHAITAADDLRNEPPLDRS